MSLESLAHALRGNLTYDATCERDWDRLTALAWGSVTAYHRSARESLLNSLGVSLIAFKHANRLDVFRQAVNDLRDCLRWRLKTTGRYDRHRLAILAIREWSDDNCPICFGSGHVYDVLGVQRTCGKCGGSRKYRYTDEDRADGLRVSDGSKWAYSMDIAHAQIAFAVGLAAKHGHEKLRGD